jgi:hypothetical protein
MVFYTNTVGDVCSLTTLFPHAIDEKFDLLDLNFRRHRITWCHREHLLLGNNMITLHDCNGSIHYVQYDVLLDNFVERLDQKAQNILFIIPN